MANLLIQRVNALPGVLVASTMYIVKAADDAQAELYFTSADGQAVRHLLNAADVAAMIADAVPESANQADKLSTPRVISATGDASYEVTFDGSADATAVLTLAEVVEAGSGAFITFDAKGRVTESRALVVADIPSLPGSKITSELSVDTTGNAATATLADKATALATPRLINGVEFDGTEDITINAVDSTARIAVSEKGQALGVATLDANGFVPASQLPSYVDDVIEVADFAALPNPGEASKIYVTLDNNFIFRWAGSSYIQIPGGVGLADAALKLQTPRSISATGDATWTTSFDGSANATGVLTLATVNTNVGEYNGITVNAKGLVTAARDMVEDDLPELTSAKVVSAASVTLVNSDW